MRTPLRALLLFLATLALVFLTYRLFFRYGFTHEFGIYADIGRSLASGEGFSTLALHPSNLAWFDAAGLESARLMPAADRFPLWGLFISGVMRVIGATDLAMVLACGISLALFVVATYLLGRKLFDETTALVGALLIMLCPTFLKFFVLWGYAAFLFGIATLALLWMLTVLPESKPRRQMLLALLIGATLGLGYLIRPNMILWLPIALIAEAYVLRGWRAVGAMALTLGAGLLVTAPYLIWMEGTFGTLVPMAFSHNLGSLGSGAARPFLDYAAHDTLATVTTQPLALLTKAARNLLAYLTDLPLLWQMTLVFPFFVVAIFQRNAARPRRLLTIALIFLATCIAAFAFVRYERFGPFAKGRYFVWFAPVLVLFGVEGFRRLAARFLPAQAKTALRIFVLATMALYALVFSFVYNNIADETGGRALIETPAFVALAKIPEENARIATNIPAQVAWYLDRPSVSLPNTPEELVALQSRHPISALFISTLVAGEMHHHEAWTRMLTDPNQLDAFLHATGLSTVVTFPKGILLLPQSAPQHPNS